MNEIRPGDQVHFYGSTSLLSGLDLASSMRPVDVRRGSVITVTQNLLDSNKDKNGESIFDVVDDPEAQVRKWGHQLIGRGPWPEDLQKWTLGTVEADLARDAAMKAALERADVRQRKAALAEVEREFGPRRSNQTLAHYAGDGEKLDVKVGE